MHWFTNLRDLLGRGTGPDIEFIGKEPSVFRLNSIDLRAGTVCTAHLKRRGGGGAGEGRGRRQGDGAQSGGGGGRSAPAAAQKSAPGPNGAEFKQSLGSELEQSLGFGPRAKSEQKQS
jgi:hypothetical protein